MDECIRLEEALQAEESRNAEGQSPRPRPERRRSRWPFSLKDFAKTDEYRLPPLSTELAAFSPGPAEASPRRRGTNPSSPRNSQGDDSQNDLLRRATRSPHRRVEPRVEQVSSHSEARTREERRAIYSTSSNSKHRDRHRGATSQSPVLPGAVSMTDLQRLRDSENPRRRHSLPIPPQTRTYTHRNRDGEYPTGVEIAPRSRMPASSEPPILASEPEPDRTAQIIKILNDEGTRWPVKPGFKKISGIGVEFTTACGAYVLGEFSTNPRQYGALLMMEITTVFPTTKTDQSQHSILMGFNYATEPKMPGPKIFNMATYALDKENLQAENGGRINTTVKPNRDSGFTLELKECTSSATVVHIALLLQHSGGKATREFWAGAQFHGMSVELDGTTLQRMHPQADDIELRFKPGKPEPHAKPLALDDIDLHQLLLKWVHSK